MNQKSILSLLLIFFSFFACAERKKSDNTSLNSILALTTLNSSCSTLPTTVTSIGNTTRTEYNFTNCNNPSVLTGFTVSNISAGLTGTSTNSKMASSGTFGSSENKINIEVTYSLTTASSNLDIIALGAGTGTSISGPGFRISTADVKFLRTDGTTGAFGTGTSPTSALGTSTTLCLEVHKEGSGAHIFGWKGACSSISNRGTYEFDQEDVSGTISDRKISFTLDNVVLTKIIISNGAIGSAGSLQSF